MKFFGFILFIFFISSCSRVETKNIGEEGEVCFSNNVCKNGLNLQCIDGICVNTCKNYCKNGGTCVVADYSNDISCICRDEFSGDKCEKVNPCFDNPCLNEGICNTEEDSYTCECKEGFEGTNCEININDCNPNPCQNDSTCTDGINSYTCECKEGFEGINCEININDCKPNPCQNDSTCTDGINSYTCNCENTNYHGTNCEIKNYSCKLMPRRIGNIENFDGKLYLELTSSEPVNKNDIGKIKLHFNDEDLLVKYWGPKEEKYKLTYYFILSNDVSKYNEYYASIEIFNDIINCDVDGSDNQNNNINGKNMPGSPVFECKNDYGIIDSCPKIKPLCVYGKCEKKASGQEDCLNANFNGHFYKFCKFQKTWSNAKENCGADYNLLKIDSVIENEWIKKNIHNEDYRYFIGLNDIRNEANTTDCDVDCAKISKNWKWENDESFLDINNGGYNNWYPDEPNNSSGGVSENCVEFLMTGQWNDAKCDSKNYYICETSDQFN